MHSSIQRLEADGDIEWYWGNDSQGGRRKYFRITEKGKATYASNKSNWEYAKRVLDTFENCIFNGVDFKYSDLRGICFDGQTFIGVKFDKSALNDVSFRGATLKNVSFTLPFSVTNNHYTRGSDFEMP